MVTRTISSSGDRLAFADLLRGPAALAVAIGHFTVLFLTDPNTVAKIALSTPGEAVKLPAAVADAYSVINPASLGVAVFFLISGFVIPLSLDGVSARVYFVRRFARIFPTYWVVLAIGVAILFASAAYWSRPIVFTWKSYLGNFLLAADLFSLVNLVDAGAFFDMLSVTWTLQIELKFYLLAPFLHAGLAKGSLRRPLLWAGAVAALYWAVALSCGKGADACWSARAWSLRFFVQEAMFIGFMMIGSVLYAHYRKRIATGQAIFAVMALLGCFMASLSAGPFAAVADAYRLPYLFGFAIFVFFYVLRDRIRLTPPFRFLANISYPLYLIHPIAGYVTMRLLMANGWSYPLSLATALALVVAAAAAIHAHVEEPAITFGKRLAAAVDSRARERRAPAVLLSRSESESV